MYEQVYTGIYTLIGALSGGLITYVIVKRSFSTDAILVKVEELTDEIMRKADLQKKLYLVGALIGQGISQGIGIQKKGGKFGLEQIIAQVLPAFISKMTGNQTEQQQQPGALNPFAQTS